MVLKGRKRDPTFEDGTFITFPETFKVDPIEIEDLMNLEVGVVQNNGHRQKTRGNLTLRDIMLKML